MNLRRKENVRYLNLNIILSFELIYQYTSFEYPLCGLNDLEYNPIFYKCSFYSIFIKKSLTETWWLIIRYLRNIISHQSRILSTSDTHPVIPSPKFCDKRILKTSLSHQKLPQSKSYQDIESD